jgi:TonB dependent receptor
MPDFHDGGLTLNSVLYPPASPYRFDKGEALVDFPGGEDVEGFANSVAQRQLNFVDTFSWALGVHQLKFGIDYRRLRPKSTLGTNYAIFPAYTDLLAGTTGLILLDADNPFSVTVNNSSLFAQDTWRVTNHVTLTYGLRWEINTPPVSASAGQPLYAIQGIFDSNPIAAVPGALWHTRFGNFAPRFGVAYQATPKTVLRGGGGVFYDLGYGYAGYTANIFPYHRNKFISKDLPFDVTQPAFQPPPFSTTFSSNVLNTAAFDPHLQLPYTLQWNAAIERALGAKQTLTATYLGSEGERLMRGDGVLPPALTTSSGNVTVTAIRNAGYSHYNAFQLQFQQRMSHGLQALVSYNLAKSSDLGSTDSSGLYAQSVSEIVLPPLTPSDYDVRQFLGAAVSYEMPAPSWGGVGDAILKGWAVDGLVRVFSGPPINVTVGGVSPVSGFYSTQAEIVPGQPSWISDRSQPSGEALNPAAFSEPPAGQVGDFPRNGLRSPYSINQTDVALRRRFDLSERVKLDVRAEYFNVFNHPMFGLPGSNCAPDDQWSYSGGLINSDFGKVCSTANLDAGGGQGGQNALYAPGGPRSGQFTLKLLF